MSALDLCYERLVKLYGSGQHFLMKLFLHFKIQAKNQFARILTERNEILAAQKPKEMVVRFVVDSDLPDDISTMTLSYTFFKRPF